MERFHQSSSEEENRIDYFIQQSMLGRQKFALMNENNLRNSPVVNLVNHLIEDALEQNASDIHLEPLENFLRVRFRIDGLLREMPYHIPKEISENVVSRIKIMAHVKIEEHRLPQDGRIDFSYNGEKVDIRLSTLPTLLGESIVLRLLSGARKLLNISELGFSSENEKIFRQWIAAPHGMILNVGPVNSGKTTTIYAALQELNSQSKKIITLEDPVEYFLSGVNQVQMNEKIGLTFDLALQSILRQDLDIVAVSEIRNIHSLKIALQISLTGHLLFTTLHAENCISAIFRLLEMGVEDYLLAASLLGILAQRLVRRLCPHCRQEYFLEKNSNDYHFFEQYGLHFPAQKIFRANPSGCEFCHQTGYLGRVAIHECLPMTENFREAIQHQPSRDALENLFKENHFVSLHEDGLQKVLNGETSLDELKRVLFGEKFLN